MKRCFTEILYGKPARTSKVFISKTCPTKRNGVFTWDMKILNIPCLLLLYREAWLTASLQFCLRLSPTWCIWSPKGHISPAAIYHQEVPLFATHFKIPSQRWSICFSKCPSRPIISLSLIPWYIDSTLRRATEQLISIEISIWNLKV